MRKSEYVTQLEQRVSESLGRYQMLKAGDRVVVGLSGGADSVALVDLLWRWRKEIGITLKAVHLNHLYRGEEAYRDEEFARKFCKTRGIPFVAERVAVAEAAKRDEVSFQQAARDARYQLFEREAEGGKIATAHTLSDSVETVLLNLVRGTGLTGLGGIPPVRGQIVRPLIGGTREQVERYCSHYRLEYVTDSTNLQEDYRRNKLRSQVVPVLKEMNPELENSVGQMTQLVTEDAQLLEQLAGTTRARLATPEGTDRERFLQLPRPIAHRIIGQMLEEQGLEVSYQRTLWVYEDVEAKAYRYPFSYWSTLVYKKESFRIQPVAEYGDRFEVEVDLGRFPVKQKIEGTPGKFLEIESLECKETENIEEFACGELYSLLDYDKIGSSVTLRQPHPEDHLAPVGREGTVSLKKLYRIHGVGAEERRQLFVLADHLGVLWVEGQGADRRGAVSPSTTKALKLLIKKNTGGETPTE